MPTRAYRPKYVSISEIKTFRSCNRKWYYEYFKRMRTSRSGMALMTGTVVHKALEIFWGGGDWDKMSKCIQDSCDSEFWYSEKGQLEYQRISALMFAYFQRWDSDRKDWVVEEDGIELWIETSTEVEIVTDAGMAIVADSIQVPLVVRLDVLARYKPTGDLWIIDHKTTSEDIHSVGDDYWQRLGIDTQISQYMESTEEKYDEPIKFLYDVLKKIDGKTKPKLRTGKDGEGNKIPGSPARRKNEPDDELAARKAEHEKLYRETHEEYGNRHRDAILADMDGTFVRREVIRLGSDRTDYAAERNQTLAEMCSPRTVWPRNDSHCSSRYGMCPFLGVCSGTEQLDSGKFEHSPPSYPGHAQNKGEPSVAEPADPFADDAGNGGKEEDGYDAEVGF